MRRRRTPPGGLHRDRADAAHTAIDTWADAAREAVKYWFPARQSEEVYERRILAAGHPPVERLTIDVDAESRCLAEELTARHERRLVLTSQTLGAPAAH
ncbi:hypothetical protein [Streptomyces sp. TLI_105]|uniref:hypothetical protein n=1 Tax=Streptomyces sp. TLI_105 TaxID=1881019 RepID=UPI00089422E3|nr:hypothetical protein [Streptomyces sp. TLI_105]SEE23679.1 hypothetical protein SAMN05428939_7830 [Streptomyces sp. TLI_105]